MMGKRKKGEGEWSISFAMPYTAAQLDKILFGAGFSVEQALTLMEEWRRFFPRMEEFSRYDHRP